MTDFDVAKKVHTHTANDIIDASVVGKSVLQGSTSDTIKTILGLNNVDNTSDLNKPISNATQAALNLKANINNPAFTGTVSGINKSMVGLSNIDNTSDADKPVSTATQGALDLKADFIPGMAIAVFPFGRVWPETRPTSRSDITVLCIGQTPGPAWMTETDVLLDLSIINNNIYLLPSDTLLPSDDLLVKG